MIRPSSSVAVVPETIIIGPAFTARLYPTIGSHGALPDKRWISTMSHSSRLSVGLAPLFMYHVSSLDCQTEANQLKHANRGLAREAGYLEVEVHLGVLKNKQLGSERTSVFKPLLTQPNPAPTPDLLG
jgi:hypothetical protein